MAVWCHSLNILLALTVLASESIWTAPSPPGLEDRDSKISMNGVSVHSCPVDGYLWTVERGPDFDVFRFSDSREGLPLAGFYVGFHPNNPESNAVRRVSGVLSGSPVTWFLREETDQALSLDTLMPVVVPGEDMRGLTIHFWLRDVSPDELKSWLKWTECVKFSFGQ